MKVELNTFLHAENGVSLELIGETQAEIALLAGLWRHGTLRLTYANQSGAGYSICWQFKEHTQAAGEAK